MITKIPLQLVDLKGDGFHVSVNAKINNHDVLLILDTGASRTVFDINRIGKYIDNPAYQPNEQLSTGLGTSTMESNIFHMDSFSLGEMLLQNYETVAIDMKHINGTYEILDMPPIDGVLGGDILMDFNAKIDYKTLMLTLKFSKARYFVNLSK